MTGELKLGEIDRNLRPMKPNVFLCKPDRKTIRKLSEAYDIRYSTKIGAINKIEFKLPTLVEKDRVPIKNPSMDMIRHRYLFKLKLGGATEYFVFYDESKVHGDEEYIEYQAYSLGYQLADKMIRRYEEESVSLKEITEEFLRHTDWKVGYIDSAFEVSEENLVKRSYEVYSQTVLQSMYDVAEKFDALMRWDTIKKEIDFMKPDNIGLDKGFYVSDWKYLESFNLNSNSEETVTRLRLYGAEDISIRELSPTGSDYIEDFSWYMYPFERDSAGNVIEESYYMSNELCIALEDYYELLESKEGQFGALSESLTEMESTIQTERQALSVLETDLIKILDELDLYNADYGEPDTPEHTDIVNRREEKESEIASQETFISNLESSRNTINDQIDILRNTIKMENNLSGNLLLELNKYIIEKEYVNDILFDPEDLFKEGKETLSKMREPKLKLDMDIINLLAVVECQNDWDKLSLGDIIRVKHERLGTDIQSKITEINYDFESNDISLVIANETLKDNNDWMETLSQAGNTSTIVDMDKFKWNYAEENNGTINDLINSKWDALKNAIMAGYEQEIEISERGIIVKSLEDPDSWLVIQNGFLAITNDRGNTWKHSITKDGIVGERVYGKLIAGVNLVIEDESGIWITRGSRTTIYDRDQNEVMRLGLVNEEDGNPECFGMVSWNDITQVSITDCDGISISKRDGDEWDKVFWAHPNTGTLYAKGLVVEGIKIVDDLGEAIIDAENGIFNLGWFQRILADGKLTTPEKIEIWTKLATLMAEHSLLVEHAENYKYSLRDDTFMFDQQNPESSRNKSTTVIVDSFDLISRYNSLIDYISQYVSIPDDYDNNIMERTDEVDRDVFIGKFKDYHEAAEELREAIDNFLNYSGLNLGEFYNNLIIDKTAGFMAIRSDYLYRARLSANDGLALEKWENGAWVKKLYGALGHPDYEDGTLIAENLVTRNLRIVDGELGDRIVFDQDDGISIFGDKSNIFLNANDGIRIEVDGTNKFYVDTDGRLYAVDMTTHNLKIVDGELGEKIIFDQDDGITINGNDGEQIRLNANEGIAIDVQGDKRVWIGNDGLLYAKKLIIMGDEDDEVIEDVDGSYISDLTVNKLKTLNSNSPQDYVHIENNFIKLNTEGYGGAGHEGVTKFELTFEGVGDSAYPKMIWGAGGAGGLNQGYQYKDGAGFHSELLSADGGTRQISMQNREAESILIQSPKGVTIDSGTLFRVKVGSTLFELTPSGIKMNGSRVDIN